MITNEELERERIKKERRKILDEYFGEDG